MRSPAGRLVEERLARLSDDLDAMFAESRERVRREYAEQLNQAVRRLRIAGDAEELCGTLENAAAQFADGALLFRVEDGMARHERIEIALGDAAAFAGAVESREPQTAVTAASEVSEALIELIGHAPVDRSSLFPVDGGGGVAALVYAWGRVQGAALELLAQVAGAVWSTFTVPTPSDALAGDDLQEAVPELVTIAPAPQTAPPAEDAGQVGTLPHRTWESLPVEEQQIHLRAQRFARVQVAEMRLYEADTVQAGRARGDLYDVLRQPIDSAREKFREQFFSQCSSMVDYLHLELMRTLAHDDPDLFGKDYPGPLV